MIEKLGYNSDLIAYLDTFLDNHKKSLLLNLQCECSETDLRDIDKDLDVFRKNEKAFYDKVTSSLREYI